MKLLVTGGTGFIGSHLAESALRRGHEVTVLGLVERPQERSNAQLLEALGATVIAGSVTDPACCNRAMGGVTHVYHLAVAMREGGRPDEYFRRINLDGTRYLLSAGVHGGVRRFIYCSTIGIFGHRAPGVTNEDSPLRPGNIYEQTKVDGETLVRQFNRDHGLQAVILRPADVYGPRDERLLKLFRGVARGRFPLFGSGEGRRHMIHVDDVVTAFENAANRDETSVEALILAGPEVCTLRQLIEELRIACGGRRYGVRLPLLPMLAAAAITEDVCARLGIDPPIYRRRMDFFLSDAAFDTTRARQRLDWTPRVCLREGVALTLAAYRDAGLIA